MTSAQPDKEGANRMSSHNPDNLTPEQVTDGGNEELTDQQLNEEICKWRGWTGNAPNFRHPHNNTLWSSLPSHITGIEAPGNMRQARESLIGEQRDAYEEILRQQIGVRMGLDRDDYDVITPFDMMQATEREHAIALLKVVTPSLFQR